jgi:hypothetical protein
MEKVSCDSVVGNFIYVMVSTRLDIAHTLGFVSRYMENPRRNHWIDVKMIFRYLWGTNDYVIRYQLDGRKKIEMHGFVDVDRAVDVDNVKSSHGYIFTLFEGV